MEEGLRLVGEFYSAGGHAPAVATVLLMIGLGILFFFALDLLLRLLGLKIKRVGH